MPSVEQSIVVNAPIEFTLNLSNRLEQWPEMMLDYQSVEILRREGWKVWFRLKHKNGSTWISWRVVDPIARFAVAERHEPRAPFAYMQHTWLYHDLSAIDTKMIWVMTFELPAEQRAREQEACEYLAKHSAANQQKMKKYIEDAYRSRANLQSPQRAP